MKDLAVQLEAAALATPGVLALYRTGAVVTNLVVAAAEKLGLAADARVAVTRAASSSSSASSAIEVDVAIGVGSGASAVETAQAVRERLSALVVARGEPVPLLRITVVHVADGRPIA